MKLVTLNTWGGRALQPLETFLSNNKDIDIWCFQEVYRDIYTSNDTINRSKVDFHLYQTLQRHLTEYNSDFCQILANVYGLAAFINKNIKIIEKGETLVARGDYEDMSDPQNRDLHRKIQWLEIKINGTKILLINTHLTHRPEGKSDSEKRLNQSKIIIDFLAMFDCPKILCGDFNLLPTTESITMIERAGMRNLIKEFNIQSTRTELYKKDLKFADYIFVSPEIKVKECKILPDIVSDHSPVYLDFDI